MSGFAAHRNLTAMRFDDGFGMEHANSHPVFFRGLKGTEEGMPQELGRHPTA